MRKWYYLLKGQKLGPLDDRHISELAAAGIITPQTPILAERASDWVEYRDSELAGGDTPCRIINHIGRIERSFTDLKVLLVCGVLLIMPLVLRTIGDYILRRGEIKAEPERFYTLLAFALEGEWSSRIWLMMMAAGTVVLAATLAVWGVLLYRMWRVIPAESRPLPPAVLAVAAAVPVVSVIANFWTVAGLNARLTARERREGVIGRRPSYTLSLVFCILSVAALALPQIFLLIYFPVWGATARQLHDAAVNILHQRLLE